MKIVVSREAAADIERLHAFLAEHNAAAAIRAVDTIVRGIDALEHLPERGRSSGIPGVRELILPFCNSAYVVRYFYRSELEEIVIMRIWHDREARG